MTGLAAIALPSCLSGNYRGAGLNGNAGYWSTSKAIVELAFNSASTGQP